MKGKLFECRAGTVAALLGMVLVSRGGEGAPDAAIARGRLPRTNLMVFHNRTGAVAPVKSKKDWQERRKEIVRGMEEVMGPLPGQEKWCPFDLRTEQRTWCVVELE